MIDEAQGAITCRSSTLAILADSGPFFGLLITVLGSGVISTIEKPRVRLCVGHQHTILADSGPFRGLLLTVFGSQSDFHDIRTLGRFYVSVINTHIFG